MIHVQSSIIRIYKEERGSCADLSTIYPSVKPLLKGVHHTLEVWKDKQDNDGWNFTEKELNMLGIDKSYELENNSGVLSNMMEYGRRSNGAI